MPIQVNCFWKVGELKLSYFCDAFRKYIPIDVSTIDEECDKAFVDVFSSSLDETAALICCPREGIAGLTSSSNTHICQSPVRDAWLVEYPWCLPNRLTAIVSWCCPSTAALLSSLCPTTGSISRCLASSFVPIVRSWCLANLLQCYWKNIHAQVELGIRSTTIIPLFGLDSNKGVDIIFGVRWNGAFFRSIRWNSMLVWTFPAFSLQSLPRAHDRFLRPCCPLFCTNPTHCIDGNFACFYHTLLVVGYSSPSEKWRRQEYYVRAGTVGILVDQFVRRHLHGRLQDGGVLSYGLRGLHRLPH